MSDTELGIAASVAGIIILIYTLRVVYARMPGQDHLCWFHWYETVEDTHVRLYLRCEKCGARKITGMDRGGQPIDMKWLETGEWTRMAPPVRPAATKHMHEEGAR